MEALNGDMSVAEIIDKATLAERKRWQPVINAWSDKGKVPSYHNRIKNKLKRDWIILYAAIATAIEKDRERR